MPDSQRSEISHQSKKKKKERINAIDRDSEIDIYIDQIDIPQEM